MENNISMGKFAHIVLFCVLSNFLLSTVSAEPSGHKWYDNWNNKSWRQQPYKNSHEIKRQSDWKQNKNKESHSDSPRSFRVRDTQKESPRDYFKRKLYKEEYIEQKPVERKNGSNKNHTHEEKYRYEKSEHKYDKFPEKYRDRKRDSVEIIPEKRHRASSHTHDRHVNRPNYRIYDQHRHVYYRTPWYNTFYLAPIRHHYYPFGHHVRHLPRAHIRIIVGSVPYYYYSGVYYSSVGSDYIVVRAPVGAFVDTLPAGFIAFTLGLGTYYYVNDAYYTWDDVREGYVVVEKPVGAEQAMETATTGRLFVYPNKGQSEDQQAKDRYECHRWAVNASQVDPTEEDIELTEQEQNNYKRAISACLFAKDYTVK